VFNFRIVVNVIGALLLMLGAFMLALAPFGWIMNSTEGIFSLFLSGLLTIVPGFLFFWFTTKADKSIRKKEGFAIVALGWIFVSLFSSMPYHFSGVFDHPVDAFFETVSGLTTTGATVLEDIESVPQLLLLWRSLTQWIGGMGIIVLTVAILPLLGVGGAELFVAEAPGPTSNKIHPRIRETAKRLWYIYVGLTAILVLALSFVGMTVFDAINHGLTTMATGGFSTKTASIAYYEQPLVHYIITLFMFVAGVNYTVIYFGVKLRWKRVLKSDEFKTYVIGVIALVLSLTLYLYFNEQYDLERSFRTASFQIVSIITTTGYVTEDYTSWSPLISLLFFCLLFSGACAGSTSGGIKVIRHLVLFKNSLLEFKRLLHAKALIRIKIDGNVVQPRVMTHILVFLLLYLGTFVIGSLVMSTVLYDFDEPMLSAMGSVATSLGNVGPSIADLGPVDNFAAIPLAGKGFLSFLMLLGRLEIFTVLILLTPYFYRTN